MSLTTNDSVKLTAEQLRQIEVAQARLANFQSETALATKTLAETKGLLNSIIKEKEYQEELLIDVSKKVNLAKAELESVSNALTNAKEDLKEKQELAKTCNIENQAEKLRLSEEKKQLENDLKSHDKNAEKLRLENDALLKDKEVVNNAKKAFESALESITWR